MNALILLGLLTFVPSLVADTKEGLYFQSMRLLQEKKYAAADRSFQRLAALLAREQSLKKKGTKGWHLLGLGQCDALLYRSEISWKQGRKQGACLLRKQIATKMQMLPAKWTNWNTNKVLKRRLMANKGFLLGKCALVPSFVSIQTKPASATLFLRLASGKWRKISGKKTPVTQTKCLIKASAPGHLEKQLEVTVPRWKEKRVQIVLKPKPYKIIVIVPRRRRLPPKRRLPPPPVSLSQKWWFWTALGVGVVGVGVAAVAIGVSVAEVDHLMGKGDGALYRVWGRP